MSRLHSILFVPGSRPERFAKAADAGADAICIDLEDAVAESDKDGARESAIGALGRLDRARAAIRINGLKTAAGLRDLLALGAAETRPGFVFVPMVESPAEPEIVRAVLGDDTVRIVPLIETVKGLGMAEDIAITAGVGAIMFGGGDFAAELGTELAWEPLLAARSRIVMACASARIGSIDVPYIDLEDAAGLAAETRRAKALGFAGKAAIHPRQVPAINAVMRPSEEELAEARAALAAYEAAGRRVVRHQGRMLEAPVVRRYQQMIETMENTDA